jgi:Family of unknown function (DUF6424)
VNSTITPPLFADKAQSLWENACDTASHFVTEEGNFVFGGSCWLWDARHPDPKGNWILVLNRWAVSPFAVTFVNPYKVDIVRQQSEALVNAFPGTEERLRVLGCDHVDLLHKDIDGLDDVVAWCWSIWNACVPVPKKTPDPYQYPHHIVSTAALGREDFAIVRRNKPDVAVLPASGGVRTFWQAPRPIA